ncbi:HD-GYP domain-containing protein [Criibacterium bergeronii]|uniref:Phosphohydrolase n=1 Tax=Criibacterium bergeronii TaxID=1871336 RepID=A0A371IMF4_9FIRM|nr:HD domain-containing phosphohydrolase [Criibacterium bergeronii]RDY21657.1 phosphohydrolase [Criibacterium bergeronii]
MSDVSVNNLERGMIVNSDIFSKRGSLLLYKGFKIENPDLVSIVLHRNGINFISIKDTDENVIETVKETDRISRQVVEEVEEFKADFNKVVENLVEEIDDFTENKDISQLTELDKAEDIAKDNHDSVLTIFQLVERVKTENSNKYSDTLQVSLLSYAIGAWMGLEEDELTDLSKAAMLAGVFTIAGINSENQNELKGTDSISKNVLKSALSTRERSNGSGPLGLSGEEIPYYARIIAIADVFHALTTSNELHEKLSIFDALKVMQNDYFPLLDPKILYIFLHRVANKYIGSTLRLSDGTSGVVVFVPENQIMLPFIKTADGQIINLQSDMYKNNKIIEIL